MVQRYNESEMTHNEKPLAVDHKFHAYNKLTPKLQGVWNTVFEQDEVDEDANGEPLIIENQPDTTAEQDEQPFGYGLSYGGDCAQLIYLWHGMLDPLLSRCARSRVCARCYRGERVAMRATLPSRLL